MEMVLKIGIHWKKDRQRAIYLEKSLLAMKKPSRYVYTLFLCMYILFIFKYIYYILDLTQKDQSYQNLYHLAFQCIPHDPYSYYTNVVNTFIKNSISTNLASQNASTDPSPGQNQAVMNQTLLSNMDVKVLDDISRVWRVDAISKLCM